MMRNVLLLIPLLALAACAERPLVERPAAPGDEKALFADVPVADGLAYVDGYGHKTPSGHIRTYRQTFEGQRRQEDVVKFYRDTLPLHGWKLMGEDGKNPVTLTFAKQAEKCAVAVSSTATGVKVDVKLGAKD